jgi:hypothetical protein
MPNRSRLTLLLPAVVLSLAACGGAAGPTPSPTPDGTPRPTPTAVPGGPGGGIDGGTGGVGSGSGSGGGSGSTGGGVIVPNPGGPNENPLIGAATYVTPGTNLTGQHQVNVQLVRAAQAADGSVAVDLRWWSGVAPCNQLDHVEIARDDAAHTVRFTVVEGFGGGDVACIDIAQLTATTVNLGVLAPGTWTLSAVGDAPAISLDIP